ncbi:MAG: helix-turn-helix transcriptional regulator [Oscillibacter sp.]|nr:helix-turn-helix transcriptional regulator [Oscillibacter sp.]MBQ2996503.1 helix-turn-helix transcriptional regulator [Oscillibacter sp.]
MNNAKTGALIAEKRKALGLTQKNLAEKLHISDRTVSKWERGAGFPDVSLLEPLADALGLSVLDLIEGERQETPVTEITLRSLVAAISQHVKKTTRQKIITWVAEGFLLVMSAFILLGIADSIGLLSQKVSQECSAGIYENGALTEETTVTIDGERHRLTGDFSGRFAIAAIPETCAENVTANVRWDYQFDGHSEIFYHRFSDFDIGGPLSRADLYISKDMGMFAFRLEDGRIISTHNHLVPLMMLDYYYAVDLRNVKYLCLP